MSDILYARPDSNNWSMNLYTPTGERIQRTTGIPKQGASKEQTIELRKRALAIAVKRQAEMSEAKHGIVARQAITLADFLVWYRENITINKRSKYNERLVIDKILRDRTLVGDRPLVDRLLTEITSNDIVEWRTARLQAVKASTVNRNVELLRGVFRKAMPKYLAANPCDDVERIDEEPTTATVVSPENEDKLVAAAPADFAALIVFALDTLIRLGDLLDLRRSDVYIDERGRTRVRVAWSKNGQSYTVGLSSRVVALLPTLPADGYLFAGIRGAGGPQASSRVAFMLEDLCQVAGVAYGRGAGLTFHSFRHTGATRMIQRGVDLKTIQKIGNWKSLDVLIAIYLHSTDALADDAVEVIGRKGRHVRFDVVAPAATATPDAGDLVDDLARTA